REVVPRSRRPNVGEGSNPPLPPTNPWFAFLYSPVHSPLPSFPTRRSSDLTRPELSASATLTESWIDEPRAIVVSWTSVSWSAGSVGRGLFGVPATALFPTVTSSY